MKFVPAVLVLLQKLSMVLFCPLQIYPDKKAKLLTFWRSSTMMTLFYLWPFHRTKRSFDWWIRQEKLDLYENTIDVVGALAIGDALKINTKTESIPAN